MSVLGMEMRVMALEDVLVTKLMALSEHSLRYESLLAISRALREQVDWDDVRARTAESPWARAFFVMLEGLGDPRRGEAVNRRPRDARACAHASRFGRRKRGVGAQQWPNRSRRPAFGHSPPCTRTRDACCPCS